uniref:UDP-glucuronosyltransferase n=1 Tax=Homalodisca liturata TaxID=320908 RepID=A0A1B6JVS6_9HEMI
MCYATVWKMRLLIPILMLASAVESARILSVFPISGKSHHGLFQAVLKALAARGHHIVNYSPYKLDKPMANYTDVVMENIQPPDKNMTREMLEMFMNLPSIGMPIFLWMGIDLSAQTFSDKKIKELIESNEQFDLVIIEALFTQEAFLGFGHKFKAPVICLQPFNSFSVVNKAAGNPLSISYIPDMAFSSSDHMSFFERFCNTISIFSSLIFYYTIYTPKVDVMLKENFKDPTMPPVSDLIYNISLFMTNGHPYVHYAQPYTPNMIPIGGIHLSKEKKPLPADMKKFIDDAKDGVIYFSLGSVVPDHVLGEEFFDMFTKAFQKLPQRVLWKTGWKHESLPNNVKTANWMPQQDILAHPNVVLFMTHGGIFGQHEAIHAGVPVVCIPIFGDQTLNAKFYEERGIGVKIPFQTLSEETIISTVNKVVSNSKYKENMERLSKIYHDRPKSAADSLVYWVEYVLRHGGAHHLRPASANMPWYQLYLLDVVAALLLIAAVIVIVVYIVLRKILRLFRGKTKPMSSNKKKKN